jgi:cytochrome c oxidase assembly factor CtaG
MDVLGILLLIVGAYLVISIIADLFTARPSTAGGWIWKIFMFVLGCYALYVAKQRLMPPPPSILGMPMTNPMTGGRRRR